MNEATDDKCDRCKTAGMLRIVNITPGPFFTTTTYHRYTRGATYDDITDVTYDAGEGN